MPNPQRVTQYAIQTPNSKTILVITEDLAEARQTLDMIGQGRLLTRTVSYGPWQEVDTDLTAAS